jgi:hypothetical protein
VSASKHNQYGAMQRKNPKCVRVTKYLHSLSLDAELAQGLLCKGGPGRQEQQGKTNE